MRIVPFGGFLLFASAALLQTNDPDPALWVVAYAVPALLSLIAAFTSVPRYLLAVTSALYFLAAWQSRPAELPDLAMALDSMAMASLGVEEIRESFGLAIVALWMMALFVVRGRRARDPDGFSGRRYGG